MTRQAVALALLAFLAAAPLVARAGASKAVYTCGTDQKRSKRTEGRLDTWSLSSLGFTPDLRTLKPLRIRYKSIRRIEFGSHPDTRIEPLLDHPCPVDKPDRYLTIFYKETLPDGEEEADNPDDQDPKAAREARETAFERKYGTKTRTDVKSPKRKDERDQSKSGEKATDNENERQKEKDKESVAVFVLGEGEVRPTLRIIETRSGKRVGYQNAAARKAAR